MDFRKNPHASRDPIAIIYKDACFIAFDKPTGLLVIPSPKKEERTLVNIVNEQQRNGHHSRKLYPCHRLDKETSGVIFFAKGKYHQQLMMELFKRRRVQKTYIACIHGRLKTRSGIFKSSIRDLEDRKFRKKAPAKWAVTKYQVLKEYKQYSVVKVTPITGRTNQICIQFSEKGHPLVGERKYAFARDYYLKFKRVALHALELALEHPITHKKIIVKSKMPKDLEVFIARNRN